MDTTEKGLTRRDFVRGAAATTIAGGAGLSAAGQESQSATKAATQRAKVVLIRDAAAVDDNGKADDATLARMLDQAVTTLLDESDPVAAWKQLVKPDDTVGIKTNVWRFLRTPVGLEQAIIHRMTEAGVAKDRIGVDDRGIRENPLFQNATALVNVRPMRTHHWAGVGSLIKNYIMFDEKPYTWHEDSCANLAGVWVRHGVDKKTRLNILVMLTPLFHGKGPHHFQAGYTWAYKGLIVSTDPVAADATGLRILEAKRRAHFGKDEPFAIPPHHIRVAQDKFKLGVADPERIDLIKLGWDEEILI
jgi:Domain of unknown function (DUF362)